MLLSRQIENGIATFYRDRIIISLMDSDGFNSKQMIINVPNMEATRLFGISSVPNNENHGVSARLEIFFKNLPSSNVHNPISYNELLNLDVLADHEKLLLINKRESVLTAYSEYDYLVDKILAFKKYMGDYLAFIPNAYKKDNSLFQLTLEIDLLGRVREVICIDVTQSLETHMQEVLYLGNAILLNDTLRLTNENELKQKSEYLFKVNLSLHKPPSHMQGITLDTDQNSRPCADACVAIRKELFPAGTEFKAKIIKKGTREYEWLDDFFTKNLKISAEEYFYQYYPSIRFKKK